MEIKINKIIVEKGLFVKPAQILLKQSGICEVWVDGKKKRVYPTIEDVYRNEDFFYSDDEMEYKRGLTWE